MNGDGYSDERPPGLDGLDPLQYGDLYHEDDVPLADVRQNALRLLVYGGIGLAILFVILGATIQLPRHLTLDFVVRGEGERHTYRFFDPVYLEAKYVTVGEAVEAGAPLVKVSSPEVVRLVDAYEDAEERLARFEAAEQAIYGRQIEALELEAQQLAARAGALREQQEAATQTRREERRKLQARAEQAARTHERQAELAERDLVSQSTLEAARAARTAAEAELAAHDEAQREALTAQDALVQEAELEREIRLQQVREKERTRQAEALRLRDAHARAERALRRSYGDFEVTEGGLILRAPTAGRVAHLADVDREVPAGTVLLRLQSAAADLYATAAVPPQRIGLVEEGDEAVLKVETFPHYEWGVATGEVAALSRTPDETGRFLATVRLTGGGRVAGLLQPGMTGDLSIRTEQKSFFGYLFEHLKKGYAETVRG